MTILAKFQRTITDEAGNAVASPTIEVRNERSGALATLYSDRAGSVGIANPFTGTAEGLAEFFVAGGAYKVTATFGGDSVLWRYVGIGTAQEYDVAGLFAASGGNIYVSEAAGIAATDDGDYFWVVSGDSDVLLELFLNDSDTAVSQGELADSAAFGAVLRTDVAQQWDKTQNFDMTQLSIAGSAIAWNLEDNQVCEVTLTEDCVLSAPTNIKKGATYILIVKQDSTGGWELTYNAAYKWPFGFPPVVSPDAGEVSILTFVGDYTENFLYGSYNFDLT